MAKIDFYFDFLSPYSYLAWTWVRSAPHEFHFFPVSVASIVASFETKGPGQIGPKRNYLFKDLLRYSKLHGIPFTTPVHLPFNSLYALRFALKGSAGIHQAPIIDALFRAGWEEGQDIGNDDVLKNILKAKGLYTDELVARMESKEARIELKENIQKALQEKIFGVPSFIVDKEMFWGNDSIKYLEMYLEGRDPLDLEKYQQFINNFPLR